MFSFLSQHPPRTNRISQNPVVFENGKSSMEFIKAGDELVMRGSLPPFTEKNATILQPPAHYHLVQTEHFKVVSGVCKLFKDDTKTPWKILDASDPNGEKTGDVPPMTLHTFCNGSSTEGLVLDVTLTPESAESEERFFRNFFCYQDDCMNAGIPLSPFQLMVFLHSADTPLAFPVGKMGSKFLLVAFAWVGRNMLGYKASYPEYYEEKKST